MFASKALPDRFPYRVGEVRVAYEGTLGGKPTVYDPRPFDPTMHNSPNRVLAEMRQSTYSGRERTYLGFLDFADETGQFEWTAAERDHARRVLERLARFSA